MNYEFLICEIENKVAIVTINRPPVNPLNTQVFHELSSLFGELEENEEVRVIVFTGSGRKHLLQAPILMKWQHLMLSVSTK